MTGQKNPPRARSCPSCKFTGSPGVHWIDPAEGAEFDAADLARLEPYSVPCPAVAADNEAQRIEGMVADQHTAAFKAAKRIVADFADTRAAFSANDCADAMDNAGVPSSLRGSAFSWAAREGLIEETTTRERHRDPAVRHKIPVWRSLRFGAGRRAAG